MYSNNFCNQDPTHVFWAKYYTAQSVLSNDNSPEYYVWNESTAFKHKPIRPRKQMHGQIIDLDTEAKSVFLETKWHGLPYCTGDFIEWNGTKYVIKEAEKDETRMSSFAFPAIGQNPNTYWILWLVEVNLNIEAASEENA